MFGIITKINEFISNSINYVNSYIYTEGEKEKELDDVIYLSDNDEDDVEAIEINT